MTFVVNVEYKRNVPLYLRVSDALRGAIREGRLAPGDPVPSVRDLAASLKISRATALKALEALRSDGLLESTPGLGTHVKSPLSMTTASVDIVTAPGSEVMPLPRSLSVSDYGSRILGLAAAANRSDAQYAHLNYGAPPLELAPLSQWSSLLLDYCRTNEIIFGSEASWNGYPPLMEALSAYLQRARAVRCHSSQVLTFSSKQLRLELIARVLIAPGDIVAVEEPGFLEAKLIFKSHGAQVVPVPLDCEGIDVDYLASITGTVKAVYVTPSHQDPTGRVMSMSRRRKLIAWARQRGVYIIEDDYDSEYRYGHDSLPSLQGLDGECVIYVASLWKILFHVLRFGFIVAPNHLIKVFTKAKFQMEQYLPTAEQVALAAFINQGHLERHIHKTQKIYARRRQSLIYALTVHLREPLTIESDSAGMHLLVRIASSLPDHEIVKCALSVGLPIMSTEAFYEGEPKKGEFIIQFSHLDPDTVADAVSRWASMIVSEGQ